MNALTDDDVSAYLQLQQEEQRRLHAEKEKERLEKLNEKQHGHHHDRQSGAESFHWHSPLSVSRHNSRNSHRDDQTTPSARPSGGLGAVFRRVVLDVTKQSSSQQSSPEEQSLSASKAVLRSASCPGVADEGESVSKKSRNLLWGIVRKAAESPDGSGGLGRLRDTRRSGRFPVAVITSPPAAVAAPAAPVGSVSSTDATAEAEGAAAAAPPSSTSPVPSLVGAPVSALTSSISISRERAKPQNVRFSLDDLGE